MFGKISTYLTAAILLAVFFYSSVSKIFYIQNFIDTIKTWKSVPEFFYPVLLIVIPLLELVGAVWLLVSVSRLAPRVYLASLLVLFTLAVLYENHVSGGVACGCFGARVKEQTNVLGLVVRNGILVFLALAHPSVLRILRRSECERANKESVLDH